MSINSAENHENVPAETLPAPGQPTPPDAASSAEAASAAASRLSWSQVKAHYLEQVQDAGFDDLPEPDSTEFPHFLARLNAKNPQLARQLVQETRQLRRGMDRPAPSAAAKRRERNRAARRMMLMRQTPDGRWVLDKQKAPMYGMVGLLALGGLLTAVYALPRLNGKSAFATVTPVPTSPPSTKITPAPVPPDPQAAAALARSKAQLKVLQQRTQMTAAKVAPRAPSPVTPTSAPQPKVLTAVHNPPPPPVVATTQPAIFTPVETTPAPTPHTVAETSAPPTRAVRYDPPPETPSVRFVSSADTPESVSTSAAASGVPFAAVSAPDAEVHAPKAAKPSRGPRQTEALAQGTTRPSTTATLPTPASATRLPTTSTSNMTPDTQAQAHDAPLATAVPFGGDSPPVDPGSAVTENGMPSSNADTAPSTTLNPVSSETYGRGIVYERKVKSGSDVQAMASAESQESTAATAETPFGSDVTNPASKIGATGPFKPLQQVPAALLTGLRTPNGGSVPVVAMTQEGGSFVGVATVNATLARVDLQFRRYIAPDGQITQVDALAYTRDATGLTQGLPAKIEAVAPTLALDAAQNSANALNTYVQNAAAAAAQAGAGTTINLGNNSAITGSSAASLAQTLVGGLGTTFRMPDNTQSIIRVATVRSNTPMIVIAGLGGQQ